MKMNFLSQITSASLFGIRGRQSRFIESLLVELPIPYIFLAETKSGRYEIVDGSQRIRTLVAFLHNDLQIERLEVLKSLNGFKFSDLDIARQWIYNMIKGVFFHILQESFDKVTQNKNNCPDEFLFMVADYYFKKISNDLNELNKYNETQKSKQPKLNFIDYKQSIDTHKNVNNIQNNLNKLQAFHYNIEYIPSFSDYVNNFKLFSGNLDENEIRKYAEKFGAKFNGMGSDKFLTFSKRNKLAHGEAKYSIECRDMLDTDIKKAI